MRRTLIAFALIVGFMLAASWQVIAGEPEPLWTQLGIWQIRIDRTLGNGCFMLAGFGGGTIFRVGVDPANSRGYMMVGNDAWRSLTPGQHYELTIKYGNALPWKAQALAATPGDSNVTFLLVTFNDSNFLTELAGQSSVAFYYAGRYVTSLDLSGSRVAVQSMISCQETVFKITTPRTSDPFAASDPFHR